ncbi:hypothetical protein [Actinophytocola sp.]|uniref:hypothetical protein n=1 Tax=Actinophytocola sp. TaxID=1872138 RepID=UPI0025C1A955|nr:hypothetical protein [Actinophytocola sp.]
MNGFSSMVVGWPPMIFGCMALPEDLSADCEGFTEGGAPVAGYWLLDVASRREAAEWVRRCPYDGEVDIQRVTEPAEYATLSPEHEDYLRAQIAHR